MSEDHLSNEVSVTAEVTPTGVKAKAKSRIISAFDRLLGGVIDRFAPKLEGPAAVDRSLIDREVRINHAVTEKLVEMIHEDRSIAERVLEQHFGKLGIRQENKEAVVTLALEDLRNSPPSDTQNESGPEQLDDDFLNRFERYAEDASSDALRERWARVLAAEVRSPGSMYPRAMRIIDELSPTTAALFERLFVSGVGDIVIRAFAGELTYEERQELVSSELLDGTESAARLSGEGTLGNGTAVWAVDIGGWAVAIPKTVDVAALRHDSKSILIPHDGRPVVPIYSLTPAGKAIASILPCDPGGQAMKVGKAMSELLTGIKIVVLRPDGSGGFVVNAAYLTGQLTVP